MRKTIKSLEAQIERYKTDSVNRYAYESKIAELEKDVAGTKLAVQQWQLRATELEGWRRGVIEMLEALGVKIKHDLDFK